MPHKESHERQPSIPTQSQFGINGEQLTLPLDLRQPRTVYWINADLVEHNRFLLPNIHDIEPVMNDDGTASITEILAEEIDQLEDPDLRYALRFSDATNAVGGRKMRGGSIMSHFVTVTATNEGLQSKYIDAQYSGQNMRGHDSFIYNLTRQSETLH